MFDLLQKKANLQQVKIVAQKLARTSMLGDIYLLNGELGSGKTTFARFFINSIFEINLIKKPHSIKSPSFPIMINYSLKNFDIFHYDLYRLTNENDLIELNINENLKENITLIEWPNMIVNNSQIHKYFFVNLKIIALNERIIEITHTHNKNFNNEI